MAEVDLQNRKVSITQEGNGYVVVDLETGTATQGDTPEDAMQNLAEAVELYLEPNAQAQRDDRDPEINPKLQRFAELQVERESGNIDRILDQHASDLKWLTASLLLINSGAAVAALNSDAISLVGKQEAGLAFVIGIALALAIGILSQKFGMRLVPALTAYRAFWLSIDQGERFDAESERAASGKVREAAKFGWVVPATGWLSFASFVTGCFELGAHLVP